MAPMRARRAGLTAATLLMIAAVGCNGADEPSASIPQHEYVTLPGRTPPVIEVTAYDGAAGRHALADDALFFLAPKDGDAMTGPLIVDSEGEPVWIGPDVRGYDLRVQRYRGKPVLTWWRQVDGPRFTGEVVIMNRSYRRIATVTTRGMPADPHETTLTPRGTALLIGYRTVARDLRNFGGPRHGWVKDDVVQEVDVATGRVLFEWRALDHIPLIDSRVRLPADEYGAGTRADPWDFAHVNSVTEDGDSLLISARNTCAIYRVDRTSGDVDWILGGRSNDFRFVGGARFAWQHDAQRQPDGTITLLDNHGTYELGGESRGLRLRVDVPNRTAAIVGAYRLPGGRLAATQGNMQVRADGHVVVGWGASPQYSEFTAGGRLLLDADFDSGESYRVYRMPWVGMPTTRPTLVVADGTAFVSWNGATEVAAWRFLARADADDTSVVTTVARDGFETSVDVPDQPYVAVQALDADGTVLGTAEVNGG
jgi:hypothetical protein